MEAERGWEPRARIVIIGGGVAGASIAYHLAVAGERDVLLLDRAELTSGSTFHSAGMVGQLRSDPTLTRLNMYSVELYRSLERSENPVSWVETGSIRLASSAERMTELLRQLAWARGHALPMERISAARAQELFPPMSTANVVGGVYLPTDGYLDPSQLCYSLAAGARARGVRIRQHTAVTGVVVNAGRVCGVRTDRGDIECEILVNAGGMLAAEIGRMAGVRIPLVPMSHQYLVTDAIDGLPPGLPSLRDPDLLVYYRPEGNGLLMGGYERTARPFTADATHLDRVPPDFNGKLLAEDWDRSAEIADNAHLRVPAMADAGVRRMINGPEAFTPDNEFCLGETDVDGLFVAAGFCAHGIAAAGGVGRLMADWVLTGRSPMNVWPMDISRFGTQFRSPSYTLARTVENYQTYYDIPYPGRERWSGRPLKVSPVYAWHTGHGAVFGEKGGWERVNYYDTNSAAAPGVTGPPGWAGRLFAPAVAAEHLACRRTAALFDESSFAKLTVEGPDAVRFLQWVCDNDVDRMVGAVIYTQALNAAGGIECDITVTRTGSDAFRVVTGTAFGSHDASWLRRQVRAGGFDVRIDDISGRDACFALWGPLAREILQPLTGADLGDAAFPFMTAQQISIGPVPVLAQRVTFVGELGFELYTPTEYGAALWNSLWSAGADRGLVAAGYRAIESLRLEKGYRVWSSDLTPETDPLSAGLGFCVAWDKPGGFLGREALIAIRDAGPAQKLCCFVLDDPTAVVLGGEPVRVGDEIVGRVTSGGFGFTVQASIGYGYLPVARAAIGTAVGVDLFGRWVTGVVCRTPIHDPAGRSFRR